MTILKPDEWADVLIRAQPHALGAMELHARAALRAHDAALRAKLAERDRLLRQINTAHEAADRCQCEMYLDCQHARLQREAREALRAALEGGPR